MKLDETVCEACLPEAEKLSDELTSKFLNENNSWSIVTHKNVKKLEKNFQFKNFMNSKNFIDKISEISEKENHHPDISFGWAYAKIIITTHAIEGLSENDFILAAKIDQIFNA